MLTAQLREPTGGLAANLQPEFSRALFKAKTTGEGDHVVVRYSTAQYGIFTDAAGKPAG